MQSTQSLHRSMQRVNSDEFRFEEVDPDLDFDLGDALSEKIEEVVNRLIQDELGVLGGTRNPSASRRYSHTESVS